MDNNNQKGDGFWYFLVFAGMLAWFFFPQISVTRDNVNQTYTNTQTTTQTPNTGKISIDSGQPAKVLSTQNPVLIATQIPVVSTATGTPPPKEQFNNALFEPEQNDWIIFPLAYSYDTLYGCTEIAKDHPMVLSPACKIYIESEQWRCDNNQDNYGLCEDLP